MSVDLEYTDDDDGVEDVRPLLLQTPPSQCTQYAEEEGEGILVCLGLVIELLFISSTL